MRAYVRLLTPEGQTVALGPGDIIGRLAGAALYLDDGRISEAHAMISLRGRELKLLGLRGLFAVHGTPVDEVVLTQGLVIEPARGLQLVVTEVVLPDAVLALEGEGLPRQLLTGAMSVTTRPLALWPRYRADAAAYIWDNGERWRLRIGDAPPRDLEPGHSFTLHDAGPLRVVRVALDDAAKSPTRLDGAVHPPLYIITRVDTVHIHADGQPVVTLDGLHARILSELASFGGPVSWDVVAGEIWRDEDDRQQLRRRWDVSLARLRRRLRESRVRPDLVRAGGTGQVELLLYRGDRVTEEG